MTVLVRRLAIAAIAATLPLALAGCGVKGPLEPPPSVAAEPAAAPAPPPLPPPRSTSGPVRTGSQPSVNAVARGTTSTAVVRAPAARQSSPLDLLID